MHNFIESQVESKKLQAKTLYTLHFTNFKLAKPEVL